MTVPKNDSLPERLGGRDLTGRRRKGGERRGSEQPAAGHTELGEDAVKRFGQV